MATMKLDGLILTVNDDKFPQYTGTYRLNAAQAAGIRAVVGSQDIEVIRDWLDDHGDELAD